MGDIKIIPYIEVDGVPTFKDSEILGFYDRMEEEGTAATMFSDGCIGHRMHFLNDMRAVGCLFIVVYLDDEIMGIMWANRFQDNYAHVHFCTFKKFWGMPILPMCGRTGSLYLLKHLNLGVLLGLVPKSNPAAVRTVVAAGGKVIGELPNAHKNIHTEEKESLIILSFTDEGKQDENNN